MTKAPPGRSSTAGYEVGPFSSLADAKFIALTTFRRSGEPVTTPVEFVISDQDLYVRTTTDAGKVKRIRNDPHVRVARCTMRGAVRGPAFEGIATLLGDPESDALTESFGRRYGFLWRVAARLRRPRTQGIGIARAVESRPYR